MKKGNSEITILRFATAFGLSDRMRFDLTINQFVREIYLNKKIEVYDPYTWRPYCHVKDFANIIFQIVSKENVKRGKCEIFNAGSSKNNFNKMMLINKIKKYIKNFKIVLQNDSADQRDYKVNFSKIKKVYGFKKITSIDEGIKEILKELKKGKFKNYQTIKIDWEIIEFIEMSKKINDIYSDLTELIKKKVLNQKKKIYFCTIHILITKNIII